jgi:hypothetical protein
MSLGFAELHEGNIMKRRLSGIILALALVCPAFGQEVPFAQPTTNANGPRLGDIMAAVQVRHVKLWYAGSLKNWPLASYELGQIKDSFEHAALLYTNIPVDMIVADTKPLDALDKVIKAKDEAGFVRTFLDLTHGCNGCHQAAQIGFLVVKLPTASPTASSFSDQSFAPTQR